MTVAFVLGNGLSRKFTSIDFLKTRGKVYACNAVYRETAVDYLVAVDVRMIQEITESKYHINNSVWTNPNKLTSNIPGINLFNPGTGWSSGPSALNLASKHGHEKIYILGFDYQGKGNNFELVNNVYAGTKNYKNVNDRATYYGNWVKQTATCIKKHPDNKYYRVVGESYFIPDELKGLHNLFHITQEKFLEIV